MIWFLFLILTLCNGENVNENKKNVKTTPSGVLIDKDTIIARNVLKQKLKKAKHEDPNHPDWSYQPIPKEHQEYINAFKQNLSECSQEMKKSDKKHSPVDGGCLIACVLKRYEIIGKDLKINKDNVIRVVMKLFGKDKNLLLQLETQLDRCLVGAAHYKEECALALQINGCINDVMKKHKSKFL